MRQLGRVILCLLLLVAVLFAGCSSSSDNTSSSGSASSSGSHSSTSGSRSSPPTSSHTTGPTSSGTTSNGGGNGNHAPTGSVSASITQGAIPVLVSFDLKGSDQDGDPLTWNIDFNGDGQTDKSGAALPATESYNYTAAGNYTVTYSISDGKATSTYHTTIDATAAAGGAGPTQVVDGSYVPLDSTTCLTIGLNNVPTSVDFKPDARTFDGTFVATWTTSAPQSILWLAVTYWAPGTAGDNPNGGGHGTFPPSPEPGATTASGTVGKAGTTHATISSCGGADPANGGMIAVHYEAWARGVSH